MEVMTREAPTPEVSPPPARSRVCETETPEVEAVHADGQEETPTEPGYGHGV
jgi:hypothetical protein